MNGLEIKPHEETRRTKIVCTIGPASRSAEMVEALISSGLDVARLHFSYGAHPEHRETILRLRQASSNLGRRVAILQDLCGTKIRMLAFAEPWVTLEEKAKFTLTSRKVEGNASIVSINIPELVGIVNPGDVVLLNDAALKLRVVSTTETDIHCEVLVGGRVKAQQAVHVPGKLPPVQVPTAKDKEDVLFGLEQGVDWIAQSYVRGAQEIQALRHFIQQHGADTPVMAKIERREALDALDEIIQAADGIMVARGDLGLEIPIETIGLVQKDIIRRANAAGKPVITATEMLVSMMEQPRPTRAEVTDITNAVFDGTDAVMLSGESAVGRYPVEATRLMARVLGVADAGLVAEPDETPIPRLPELDAAVAREACHAADSIRARLILCFTRSGRTAGLVSQARPAMPIVVFSASETVLRQCALLRSIRPLRIASEPQSDSMISAGITAVQEAGWVREGDRVVIVGAAPHAKEGTTNMIRVEVV